MSTDDVLRIAIEALQAVERWDMPATGEFWVNADGSVSDRPVPGGVKYGSNGERDHIKSVARRALLKMMLATP